MAKHILIVDDCETVRVVTRQFIERQAGLDVCGQAVDGLDALQRVDSLHPDLIVLDLMMPRMNGLEAARTLRERKIQAPIILFTMNADTVRLQDASAAGISAVVSKTNLRDLRQQIFSLLVM